MLAIFLKNKKYFGQKGLTLIEAVLYVFLLMLIMTVIVGSLMAIGKAYRKVKAARELESTGAIIMESILREVKNASLVDLANSTLGVNPGALSLLGTDESGTPYAVSFETSSGILQISRDEDVAEPLNTSAGTVSYILFNHLNNTNSEAVRIELELRSLLSSPPKTERFYGFAVLRGSY